VKGSVVFHLKEKAFREPSPSASIIVHFHGALSNAFVTEDYDGIPVERKLNKTFVDESAELPDCPQTIYRKTMVGKMSGSPFYRIKAIHSASFRFDLPYEELLTSFASPGSFGSVKYRLTVTLYHGATSDLLCEQLVAVVRPSTIPRTMLSNQTYQEATYRNHSISQKRFVHVALMLDNTGFLPSDPLSATITVTNRLKKSLKYVHFNLVQQVTTWAFCYDTKQKVCKTQDIELTGVGLPLPLTKINAFSTYTFKPEYHIPAVVPNIFSTECLQVDYFAQVRVGISRNGILTTCRIPIEIGSVVESDLLESKSYPPVDNEKRSLYPSAPQLDLTS
jgi:hypothetical protein